MSQRNFSESEIVSEVWMDEIKEARGLLVQGKLKECQALLEDIEDMMALVLIRGKVNAEGLH